MSALGMVAGVVIAIAGGLLAARSGSQLRRAGAFGGLFWSSFREYRGYRRRALRPLWLLLLGLVLFGLGVGSFYLGLTGFYFDRLGGVAPR